MGSGVYSQFWLLWKIRNDKFVSIHPRGYSLYSDDRDDRRIFLGVVLSDLVFLGVVQAKCMKKNNKTGIC